MAYSAILFSRSRMAGALLLAATATDMRSLTFGLLSVLTAAVAASLFGISSDSATGSSHAYNALLVGLGVAHTFDSLPVSVTLVVIAAGAIVLLTAALTSVFAGLNIPVLSAPFVIVSWMLIPLGGSLGLTSFGSTVAMHASRVQPLEVAGSLLFLPHPYAGLLVLAALLVHSRIAVVLAGIAASAVALLIAGCPTLAVPELSYPVALNAALTAVALGGVWFIPSAASLAIGLAGALVAVGLTLGVGRPLAWLGLPTLIFPFQTSVWLVLFAARQRSFDRRPRSVDFVSGSPEENLAYDLTRRTRFGLPHPVMFRLPFRGPWICTQGNDGDFTHQGLWKHGFDFEVLGDDGRLHDDDGSTTSSFHCFRLPVLAAAEGLVVRVVRDVPDNAIGEVDISHRWGNCVVIQHCAGLFSVVAHLAQDSVRVHEGQSVCRGDIVGLCGSSGRSPRPHLHFQLQAAAVLGAPTLPCAFSDLVRRRSEHGTYVSISRVPTEYEICRNIDPDESLSGIVSLERGRTYAFLMDGVVEHIELDIDVLGHTYLRSREHGSSLGFVAESDLLTMFEPRGSAQSVLHLIRAALPRVPLDAVGDIEWDDFVPSRILGGSMGASVGARLSFLTVFYGLEMHYRAHRDGDVLEVRGESIRSRGTVPILSTRAVLARWRWLEVLELRGSRGTVRIERIDEQLNPVRAGSTTSDNVFSLSTARSRHAMRQLRKTLSNLTTSALLLAMTSCASNSSTRSVGGDDAHAGTVLDASADSGGDGSLATIGAPCAFNVDCQSTLCTPQQTTSTGTEWQGGSCTQACDGSASCPSPAACIAFDNGSAYCVASCPDASPCRQGYVCSGAVAACLPDCRLGWSCGSSFTCDADSGECREPPQAIGAPCTLNVQCQSGLCTPEETSSSGSAWSGGYCTQECGAGTVCPSGSTCITFADNSSFCSASCSDGGTCRSGYVCSIAVAACLPDCRLGWSCGSQLQCDSATGNCG